MAALIIKMLFIYVSAAIAEICGCYAFWLYFHDSRNWLWLFAGCFSLICFAGVLTLSPSAQAGRAFAVYGGIYIIMSLLWMWGVEGVRPDLRDMIGAVFCLVGSGIIFFGPRSS